MEIKIKELFTKIKKCKKCKRLVTFREKVAFEKRKEYLNQIYWGKPVHGYGDVLAEILILGLAPAAHGANRTGRVFTGDKSPEFLFKWLHITNLSNLSNSINRNDGLLLNNIFISLVLKCVPPHDKPTSEELANCFNFLKEEISYLKNIKIVLALGKIAFDSFVKLYDLDKKMFKFAHGKFFQINNDITLISSYHPSPRNVNTGRLNTQMMVNLLKKLKKRTKKIKPNLEIDVVNTKKN